MKLQGAQQPGAIVGVESPDSTHRRLQGCRVFSSPIPTLPVLVKGLYYILARCTVSCHESKLTFIKSFTVKSTTAVVIAGVFNSHLSTLAGPRVCGIPN